MNTQTTKLGWTDRATFIGLSLTIIGFTWVTHQEYKADVRRAEEWYREDRKATDEWKRSVDEKWNATNAKYEERWADLLSKFHDHDKDIQQLKK
jgi:cyclopropane fatty-acyl-phospholipid synthase-like methyltransferase